MVTKQKIFIKKDKTNKRNIPPTPPLTHSLTLSFRRDTTNLKINATPTNAVINRITHSLYYNQNCFKYGVGMTPFSWCIPGELWTGHITDTSYMVKSGILSQQQKVGDHSGVPVSNITDKGMRGDADAHEHGKQRFITPIFLRKDRKRTFSFVEGHYSTNIAKDRAQNERMVLRPCMFGFTKCGVEPSQCCALVNAITMNIMCKTNWSFRPLDAAAIARFQNISKKYIDKLKEENII